jgi:transcriptional regulator with XRE-family HTH domain
MRQNRLAQILGIHETLLSKMVNGFREPGAEIRSRIAEALHSDASWLFACEPPKGDLALMGAKVQKTGQA